MPRHSLPIPACRLGYTTDQVREIVGTRMHEFEDWFHGQTGAICEGREFNHETRLYEPSNCGPHGLIIYPWDVEQFLRGGHPLD